jgi:phenylpropionate dioxygenase-like ring-hydroxylating dioxygenase large terminal subunit
MRQTSLKAQLSRRFGWGAVRASEKPSPWEAPARLPLGHPEMGLRNRWYLMCQSGELEDRPVARRYLGEDLVLWRDGDGVPRVMRDYCPHRGAKLSQGDIVDGDLQCWYHFWRYDGTGQCTSVPTQGGKCSLQRRLRIESTYPTEECAGYVWAWMSEEEPVPLRLPDEMEDPDYTTFPESVVWHTNWTLALENLTDIMHAPFLHSHSLTLSGGILDDRVKTEERRDGFKVFRENQQGVNFDWADAVLSPIMYVRLDIPYPSPWVAGPGPDLRILSFVTPIDDVRTVAHFPRFRKVQGWQRTLWRTLYRLRLRGTHRHVLNQDKIMLEGQRSIGDARRDEHLAQSDKGVILLRKRLGAEFEEHFARLRARGVEVEEEALPAARQSFRIAKEKRPAEDVKQPKAAAAGADR